MKINRWVWAACGGVALVGCVCVTVMVVVFTPWTSEGATGEAYYVPPDAVVTSQASRGGGETNADGDLRVGETWQIKKVAGFRVADRGVRATFTATLPRFDGASAFHDAVAAALRDEAYDAARAFCEPVDADLITESLHEKSAVMEWEAKRAYTVELFDANLVSMLVDHWDYTGGAHGGTSLTGLTYAATDDGGLHAVTLAELFRADSDWQLRLRRAVYKSLLDKKASDIVRAAPGPDGTGPITIDDLGAFTLTPRGLSFHFSPYHVGCYAEGCFRADVPLAAFRDCLRAEATPRVWRDAANLAPGAAAE